MGYLAKIVLNSLIGLLLIFLWSRFVNLAEIFKTLKSVNLSYLFLFFILFLISGFLKALRFYLILKNFKIPLKNLVFLNYLSQLLSFTIPLRIGEIAKSAYLSSKFNLNFGRALVWVFIDRFLDFWVVSVMIITLGSLFLNLPIKVSQMIYLLLIIFSIISMVMIKSANFAKKSTKFLSSYLVIPIIKRYFLVFSDTTINGFAILKVSPVKLILIFLVTVLAFTFDGLAWWLIFASLGVNLGPFKAILGSSLLALTFIIPAAPGYVGSAEAAGLAIFSGILGIQSNLASAGTVLFHILTILAVAVFGVASIYFLDFDLKLVWEKLKRR